MKFGKFRVNLKTLTFNGDSDEHRRIVPKTAVRKLLTAFRTQKSATVNVRCACGISEPYTVHKTDLGGLVVGCQRIPKQRTIQLRKWAFSR